MPTNVGILYTLATDYFVGSGRIVDGGAYLGSSSLALGMGLKDHGYPKEPVIDALDTFVIDANSVMYCLNADDPLSQAVKVGDNVRHIWTLRRTSRLSAFSDSLRLVDREANRCAVRRDFSMSMSG